MTIHEIDGKQSFTVNDKDGVALTTTLLQDHNTRPAETEQEPKLSWRPGFKARFPWWSFGCFCVVVLCTVAAVLVLKRADNHSASIWNQVRPNVILTILSSISNIFITAAVGQAVAVAWWRRASKGSTIRDLHNSWSFSTSFVTIFTEFKHFNVLALAALMTKFALIDGILYQQSLFSSTRTSSPRPHTFYANSTTTFPPTAAVYANDTKTVQNVFGLFDVLLPWRLSSNEIYDPRGFQQCLGICTAKITTIGFTVNCNTTTKNIDLVARSIANGTGTVQSTVFGIDFKTIPSTASKNYSYIEAEVITYGQSSTEKSDDDHCPATLNVTTCELRPALINYPVAMHMTDLITSVILGEADEKGTYIPNLDWTDGMTQLEGFELDKTLNFADDDADDDKTHSRLAGITQSLKESFGSSGFVYTNNGGWEMASEGQYGTIAFAYGPADKYRECPPSWANPMADIVFSMNTLMFLLSDYTGKVQNTVEGTQRVNEVYFIWRWQYTVAAVACTFVCILCILPAYWGFWELGRDVTLSPFEIANALDAPLLAHARHANGHVDEVLHNTGQEAVRYVVRDDVERGEYSRFEAHARV